MIKVRTCPKCDGELSQAWRSGQPCEYCGASVIDDDAERHAIDVAARRRIARLEQLIEPSPTPPAAANTTNGFMWAGLAAMVVLGASGAMFAAKRHLPAPTAIEVPTLVSPPAAVEASPVVATPTAPTSAATAPVVTPPVHRRHRKIVVSEFDGTYPEAAVRSAVAAVAGRLEACDWDGYRNVDLTVTDEGTVVHASTSGGSSCAANALRHARLPRTRSEGVGTGAISVEFRLDAR